MRSISDDMRRWQAGPVMSHDRDDRGTSSDWIATSFLPAIDATITASAVPEEASDEPDNDDDQTDQDHNHDSSISVHFFAVVC